MTLTYLILPSAGGKGVGRTMGEFSLNEARNLGYLAMQFNIVVKTNEKAIRLWQSLGFKRVGEIPEAFHSRKETYVDTCIMWRRL